MTQIKRGDWVKCPNFEEIGIVKRVARDGSWVDVNWGWWSKRMRKPGILHIQTTIPCAALGEGWTVTDVTRERELAQ